MIPNVQGWSRSDSGQMMARLELSQSVSNGACGGPDGGAGKPLGGIPWPFG